MLAIHYQKTLPYPVAVILAQYYDHEHIEHVHPTTLGKAELLEVSAERIVYRHIWPTGFWGSRRTSVVEQVFRPPNEIRFRFLAGRYRGSQVVTRLQDQGSATLVDETYSMPLPNWRWLERLIRPRVLRMVNAIWEEDLKVGVCIDGWPGVPAVAQTNRAPGHAAGVQPLSEVRTSDFQQFQKAVIQVEGEEVLVVRSADSGCRAVSNRCPHSGAPLSLGTSDGQTVTCPWHGAQFDLCTGQPLRGPATTGLAVYRVSEEGEQLEVS
jgi:nitrite reductase/ring-hydroxylating ferredoxin subunit